MGLSDAQKRYLGDPAFRERKKASARESYWRRKRQKLDDMLAARRIKALKED